MLATAMIATPTRQKSLVAVSVAMGDTSGIPPNTAYMQFGWQSSSTHPASDWHFSGIVFLILRRQQYHQILRSSDHKGNARMGTDVERKGEC